MYSMGSSEGLDRAGHHSRPSIRVNKMMGAAGCCVLFTPLERHYVQGGGSLPWFSLENDHGRSKEAQLT